MFSKTGRAKTLPGLLAPLLLAGIAFVYYGAYYRSGFNLADDGSVVLLSQRLLHGERPFIELALGYNLLWFYPITGLFRVFGPSLIAARIWFFFLHGVTGLTAYAVLKQLAGKRAFAFAIALVLILIPGTNNKAYIPLIVAMNGLCATSFIRSASQRKCVWIALAGGVVLGLSFLIRIDLGLFFSVIWACALLLGPFAQGGWKWRHISYPALFLAGLLAVHLPVYIDANRRGFGGELIFQYQLAARFIRHSARDASAHRSPPAPAPAVTARPSEAAASAGTDSGNMARKPLSDAWKAKRWRRRALPFLTYAPIASLALVFLWAGFQWIADVRGRRPEAFRDFLVVCTLAGGALTAFPQFFFYRPDVPHLSEFMPGAILAAAAAGYRIVSGRSFENARGDAEAPHRIGVLAFLTGLFLVAHLILYILFAGADPAAGTIAARKGRSVPFHAENGVDIYLTPEEFEGMSQLRDVVERNSVPSDYVVCYPYSPGINFMTDRRTYEKNLYADNVDHPRTFNAQAVPKIEKFRPAVITIDDWAINRTDASRFSVWAKETRDYVASHYTLAGTYFRHQVYTRDPPR